MLRKTRSLVVLKRVKKDSHYTTVELTDSASILPDELSDIILIFKSKKQAKTYLADCAKNYKLCEKLLGLENTKRQCFAYSIGRCKGACLSQEPTYAYNTRFEEAFGQKAIRPWPYKSAVLVEEYDPDAEKTEVMVIDKWCLLGKIEDGYPNLESQNLSFDYDIYKILVRYFKSPKNRKNIKSLSLLQPFTCNFQTN